MNTVQSVRIGTSTNFTNLKQRLLPHFEINDYARSLVETRAFPLARVNTFISLKTSTVLELTGKDFATTSEVLQGICRVGMLIPAEVGPALRLQYENQPEGDELVVGMYPIQIPGTDSRVYTFHVTRENGKLCLRAHGAFPNAIWHGRQKFVYEPKTLAILN